MTGNVCLVWRGAGSFALEWFANCTINNVTGAMDCPETLVGEWMD